MKRFSKNSQKHEKRMFRISSETRFRESWRKLILELCPIFWTYQNAINMNFRQVLCNFGVGWDGVGWTPTEPLLDPYWTPIESIEISEMQLQTPYDWAPVSEPGFLDFHIFRCSILEIFVFLQNMSEKYVGEISRNK